MKKTTIYEDDQFHFWYSWNDVINDEELNWFDANTPESRLAKYWASEKIAYGIIFDKHIWNPSYVNYLSQLLKKEWFR